MKNILMSIETRQREFEKLPFFRFLETGDCLEDSYIFVPGLAFFVLTFQDVLRLDKVHVTNPDLIDIINQHREEDLGHDIWYIHDMEQLGLTCDAKLLFGEQFSETRDTAFKVVSEVFRASDDYIRLAIPLALEAAGHVFFSRAYQYFKRTGYQRHLKYFSRNHLEVELDHDIFENSVHHKLVTIGLKPEQEEEALQVVDRIFAALTNMVESLYSQIELQESRRKIATPV